MKPESNRYRSSAVIASAPLFCAGMAMAQHSVDFQVQTLWEGGYNADIVVVADQGGSELDGWQLSWTGSPEVLYAWRCIPSQDGERTVLDNEWYNETIQPGNSVTLGYTGVGSWPPAPGDVRLNGELVELRIEGVVIEPGEPGMGCMGDLTGDMMVNGEDLTFMLARWGQSDQVADMNQSGSVDGADVTLLLSKWGMCEDHGDGHGGGDDDSGDGHGGGDDDPGDGQGGGDDGHGDGHGGGDGDPCTGAFIDITCWGEFHGSNNNSHDYELVGGRTAITTEAMLAYNDLRAFIGLPERSIEQVGQWAFDESLTNNSTAWGNDLLGVGLYYAMQGAKVGWISDGAYDPQILADIQRTARTVQNEAQMRGLVMDMVREFGHPGFADFLEDNGKVDTFINTLKMEPHYGGWMHGRTHGFRSIEGVAINHDINHLTVLSWDQMQPFMNDTFDWPQWPALDVSDSGVIEYFQSMVTLGNPVGQNM
ncbi:MAG: cellulose binding domain-containing protein [Planctomycetota bacterium]|nr:cellulose binding domain-containing protein [Planctomycetota bacterium]MEC9233323.1 cellulose binding domain-containing protein [Planctomycetota bacterium]